MVWRAAARVMAVIGGAVGSTLAAAAPDSFAFIGAGLMAYGGWRIYEPAGFLVGGLFFLIIGGIGVWRRS